MYNSAVIFIGAAIPIFLALVIATISRRLTKGRSNKLFLTILWLSLISSVADFTCSLITQVTPLSDTGVMLVLVFNYIYFFSRHAVNMLYIFYMYAVTRTWFRIRKFYAKLLVALPYLTVCVLLVVNTQNGLLFTVTHEEGYGRSDGILLLYGLAAIYLVYGVYMLVTRRKLLRLSEWLSLSSIYLLNIIGIGIQFVWSDILVENYFTAITLLFVVLYVQKPEIQVDMNTGLPGFFAFRDEMKKIEISGQRVQVLIASITNAEELRRYLGERAYFAYVYELEKAIRAYAKKEKLSYEFYFENPGNFYIVIGDLHYNPVQVIPAVRDLVRKNNAFSDSGVLVDMKTVAVRFPEELPTERDVVRFGHNFSRFAGDKLFYHAPQILDQREYRIQMKLDEVLRGAISENRMRLRFDPVWSVKERRAVFAEASAVIDDPEFGEIDEQTLSEVSGEGGAYTLFEETVLEQAFSYVGSGGLARDGFSYVVVKLSAAMGMQKSLTDTIWNLRSKYAVHPEQICFAIRESAYNTVGDTYQENINKLSIQGYHLTLAGYGRGYTNHTYLSQFPIGSVILDQSLISDVEKKNGKVLLRGTIRMLKEAALEVVATGVDGKETCQMLMDMGCELMSGSYFIETAETTGDNQTTEQEQEKEEDH